MNFFDNSAQVERLVADCPLYQHTSLSPILMITVFFTHYLTIGLFALSLYRHELYAFLISISLTINYFINHGLQLLVHTPPRFVGCYTRYGAPSLVTQHLLFFDVVVMTYPFFFNRPLSVKVILLLRFSVGFIVFSWIYIGANTIGELGWGALVGVVLALVFQISVSRWVTPRAQAWLKYWIFRKLCFVDTLIS